MHYKFKTTKLESERISVWLQSHKCILKNISPKKRGDITYTVSFTPVSLGDVIKVTCDCKASVDVTEYESW